MVKLGMFARVLGGLSLAALGGLGSVARADINGTAVGAAFDCNSSKFTSMTFICDKIKQVTGTDLCTSTGNSCFTASNEIFTGSTIELASPTNIKGWNGFGGLGLAYENAALCLLRDLKFAPMTSHAQTSTLLGDIWVDQDVGFLSFDPVTKVVEGYHHAKACMPVVGCADLFTQKFKFSAVSSSVKGTGVYAGNYEVYTNEALQLDTEGLLQGLQVKLPAMIVVTPYGPVSVQPEFRFGKAAGWAAAPFEGNSKSLIPEFAQAHMLDLYGRNPGLNRTQTVVPTKYAQGWISQVGLGSRDPNPKTSYWTAPAGQEFAVRPDADIKQARSKAEKTPNGYMGASAPIVYSPTGLLPSFITSNGFISFDFNIFVTPTFDAGFTSQFNLWNDEISQWKGYSASVLNFDNYRGLGLYGGSSAASRFALDAGVNLKIALDIDAGFFHLHKTLIDLHPRTTVAESVNSDTKAAAKSALAYTQMSKVIAQKSLYTIYKPLNSTPVKGEDHIKACFAGPTEPGAMPADPAYTPGDVSQLLEPVEYPCNLCIGSEGFDYVDPATSKPVHQDNWWELVIPSQVNSKPDPAKWQCNGLSKVGCYDMCTWDKTSNVLTVKQTAIEMNLKPRGERGCK